MTTSHGEISMTDLGLASGQGNLGGDAEVSGPGSDVSERTHPLQRRWSDEERARIVSETYEPGASIKSVADRHGVSDTTLSKWRRRARTGSLPGAGAGGAVPPFAPLVVAGVPSGRSVTIEAHGVVVRLPVESPVDRIVAVASGLGRAR